MPSFTRAIAAVSLLASLLLGGCVSVETAKLPPTSAEPMRVVYSKDVSTMVDLPTGAYRVPDSNIFVSGHQRGGGFGILFGVAGVLAQSAINTEIGKDAVRGEQGTLQFDVPQQADAATREALQSGQYGQTFTANDAAGGPVLQVTPYASITFVSDTDVRPYVILKARLQSKQPDGEAWTVRYICCGGAPLPLAGPDGLAANGGARLKTMLAQETREAVKLMLTDIAHPYPRDGDHLIVVDAHFPFVRNRLSISGFQLAEDPDSIVFAPKLTNVIVFTGVEKMDKASVTFKPATSKDTVFKILPN